MAQTLVGRTFGEFVVRERLGGGGGGEVYLAEQPMLARQAVIKVMNQAPGASEASDRFLREARLASRLDHPFAAHVYAFGVEPDGTLWIAMELVRGMPLDKLLAQQGPTPLTRFVPFFERLCEVLNSAHEQGIVHRDVKPANVMVLQRAGRWLPKLLDLGIARMAVERQATETGDSGLDIMSLSETASSITSQKNLPQELTNAETTQLTRAGAVVGTPHYMAPEQWLDASTVGSSADIYSLGILAYQCITGRLPFQAKGLRAITKAHLLQPLPPLGEGVPAGLQAVLQKATAKTAGDRYATTLEFAAALRAASLLEKEPPPLPQLDAGLHENVLSAAPQPLAEAVAMFEGARTPRGAIEAAAQVTKVLTRYLGILSLAAHGRMGVPASAEAQTGVSALRAKGLSDASWVALCRSLLRSFARRSEAHLVPELVRFFFDESGQAGGDVLEALVGLEAPAAGSTEEAEISFLRTWVAQLGAVLGRASFLFDYVLVAQREAPERWMGTRRPTRVVHRVSTPLERGQVAVVDSSGLVLVLAPLMYVGPPSGGAPEELFLADGPGRHGARLVALPAPFELQDETLWEWLVAHQLLAPTTDEAAATEKPPYKGLATFTPTDADNYFGREREAEAFANRLRRESFLSVVGPSGTGKSSFLLAGVLPLLPAGWRPIVFRPGSTPLGALRARLAAEGLPSPEDGVDAFVGRLPAGEVMVLVVDQFEELVTLCPEPAVREAFASTLLSAASRSGGRVRVVTTLRDDFLIKVQQLPSLRGVLSNSIQLMGTPAPEDLMRVVTEPARRVGYAFDDPELPKRMVAAVDNDSGALALLSFTAAQLWELRDRHLRLMRVKAYDALDGVGGALAKHAETTLLGLSGHEQQLARELFRNLITAQGTRAVLSKAEAHELLGGGQAATSVIEALVNARLLVSSETATGSDSVEVIHEALITAWPRLVAWQREDAEGARLRDSLRNSARQWHERGRPAGLLWRKESLAEYRVWRSRFPGRLTQLEEAFAAASLADEARGRLVRRGLAVAAFAVLAIALGVISLAYRRADASALEATLRLQRLWQEQARLALIDHKPMEAAVYVDAAKKAGAAGIAVDTIDQFSTYALGGFVGQSEPLNSMVQKLFVSENRQLLAVAATNELVVMRTSDLQVTYRLDQAKCSSADFRDEGRSLVALCGAANRYKTLFDVGLATQTSQQFTVDAGVSGFSRLGDDYVVNVIGDSVFQLNRTGQLREVFRVPQAEYLGVMALGQGRVAVYAGNELVQHSPHALTVVGPDGGVEWQSAADERVVSLVRPLEGGRVLFARGGEVALVHLDRKKVEWAYPTHSTNINAFVVDDQTVYSLGLDGVLAARSLESGQLRFSKTLLNGELLSGAVAGGFVFVGGADGVLRKIDRSTGAVLWEHHGHLGAITAVVAIGDRVFSAGQDGLVRQWDAKHPVIETLEASGFRAALAVPTGLVSHIGDHLRFDLHGQPTFDRALPVADLGEIEAVDLSLTGAVAVEFEGGGVVSAPDGGWATTGTGSGNNSISPDGHRWSAEDLTEHARVYDWSRPGSSPLVELAVPGATMLLLLNENTLVSNTTTGHLRVWRGLNDSSPELTSAHKGGFMLLRGQAANRLVTLGGDRAVATWEFSADRLVERARVTGLRAVPQSASFTADEKLLYVLSAAGDVWVYDTAANVMLASVKLGETAGQGAVDATAGSIISGVGGQAARRWSLTGSTLPPCRIPIALSGDRIAPAPKCARTQ